MTGKFLIGAAVFGSLLGANVSARILFDPQNRRAVVYQSLPQSIAVSVCELVIDRDLQASTLESTLKRACRPISPGGLTKASIECNLAEFKSDAMRKLDYLDKVADAAIENKFDDEASKRNRDYAKAMKDVMANSRRAIEQVRAEEIFQLFDDDARTPTVERVEKPEQLLGVIDEVVMLTRNSGACGTVK